MLAFRATGFVVTLATSCGLATLHFAAAGLPETAGGVLGQLVGNGLANALILPYVIRFNLPAIPTERKRQLNEVVGLPADAVGEKFVETLTQFVRNLGLPTRLKDLDVSLEGVDWDTIAEETTRMVLIHNNPRPASATDCRAIVEAMLK